MIIILLSQLLLLLPKRTSGWTAVSSSQLPYHTLPLPSTSTTTTTKSSLSLTSTTTTTTTTTTALSMGVFDSISNFLGNREGDFVKLDKSSEKEFGPGPAILLYQIPNGIDDDELRDMLCDGAPQASSRGISLKRISNNKTGSNNGDDENLLLSLSLREALEKVVEDDNETTNRKQQQLSNSDTTTLLSTDAGILASTPVLLFSGFLDREMLDSYQIIGKEVWEETGGQSSAACAKAVPAAMKKTLRTVLEEISGDHQEAIRE